MKITSLMKYVSAAMLAIGVSAASAQAKDYSIDPNHSEADFAIKHMAISTVHGTFRGVSGTVKFDAADLAKSSVDATIDVGTVSTGVDRRDGHLKSPDFFDVAKFPKMTFKSTAIAKNGEGYDVKGDLTLHGVTKPVVLKLEAPAKGQMQQGKEHRGFTATTSIKRQDYGLLWANKTSGGDAVLGDDVKIELNIEAVAQ